jgi:hypothetical protein
MTKQNSAKIVIGGWRFIFLANVKALPPARRGSGWSETVELMPVEQRRLP